MLQAMADRLFDIDRHRQPVVQRVQQPQCDEINHPERYRHRGAAFGEQLHGGKSFALRFRRNHESGAGREVQRRIDLPQDSRDLCRGANSGCEEAHGFGQP